jgi:transposase-like protein
MPTLAGLFEKYRNNGVTVASLAREYDVNSATLSRLISKHLLGVSADSKHAIVISLPSKINLETN